jgi:hypothetical protein
MKAKDLVIGTDYFINGELYTLDYAYNYHDFFSDFLGRAEPKIYVFKHNVFSHPLSISSKQIDEGKVAIGAVWNEENK